MTTTPSPILSEEQSRLLWDADRRTYLGGSDVYELLNQAQYGKGCRTALAYRKLNAPPDAEEVSQEDAALYRRGKILEPIAGALYAEQTGRQLRRPPINANGFPIPRRHPLYSWAAVNTDRLILSGPNAASVGDLEIKTRDQGPFFRVKRSGPFAGDELQMQWSMWVTNHSWGALATLGVFGSLPLLHFDRQRDERLHEVFTREGARFADEVFGNGQVPDPEISASDPRCKVCAYRLTCRGEHIDQAEALALKQMKNSKRNLVQIEEPELARTLSDMDLLKEEKKAIDQTLDRMKEEVEFRLHGLEGAWVHGYGKVYRIEVPEREVMYTADAYSYLRRYPTMKE